MPTLKDTTELTDTLLTSTATTISSSSSSSSLSSSSLSSSIPRVSLLSKPKYQPVTIDHTKIPILHAHLNNTVSNNQSVRRPSLSTMASGYGSRYGFGSSYNGAPPLLSSSSSQYKGIKSKVDSGRRSSIISSTTSNTPNDHPLITMGHNTTSINSNIPSSIPSSISKSDPTVATTNTTSNGPILNANIDKHLLSVIISVCEEAKTLAMNQQYANVRTSFQALLQDIPQAAQKAVIWITWANIEQQGNNYSKAMDILVQGTNACRLYPQEHNLILQTISKLAQSLPGRETPTNTAKNTSAPATIPSNSAKKISSPGHSSPEVISVDHSQPLKSNNDENNDKINNDDAVDDAVDDAIDDDDLCSLPSLSSPIAQYNNDVPYIMNDNITGNANDDDNYTAMNTISIVPDGSRTSTLQQVVELSSSSDNSSSLNHLMDVTSNIPSTAEKSTDISTTPLPLEVIVDSDLASPPVPILLSSTVDRLSLSTNGKSQTPQSSRKRSRHSSSNNCSKTMTAPKSVSTKNKTVFSSPPPMMGSAVVLQLVGAKASVKKEYGTETFLSPVRRSVRTFRSALKATNDVSTFPTLINNSENDTTNNVISPNPTDTINNLLPPPSTVSKLTGYASRVLTSTTTTSTVKAPPLSARRVNATKSKALPKDNKSTVKKIALVDTVGDTAALDNPTESKPFSVLQPTATVTPTTTSKKRKVNAIENTNTMNTSSVMNSSLDSTTNDVLTSLADVSNSVVKIQNPLLRSTFKKVVNSTLKSITKGEIDPSVFVPQTPGPEIISINVTSTTEPSQRKSILRSSSKKSMKKSASKAPKNDTIIPPTPNRSVNFKETNDDENDNADESINDSILVHISTDTPYSVSRHNLTPLDNADNNNEDLEFPLSTSHDINNLSAIAPSDGAPTPPPFWSTTRSEDEDNRNQDESGMEDIMTPNTNTTCSSGASSVQSTGLGLTEKGINLELARTDRREIRNIIGELKDNLPNEITESILQSIKNTVECETAPVTSSTLEEANYCWMPNPALPNVVKGLISESR